MDEVSPKVVSRSSLIEFPGHRTGKPVEPSGFPKLKRRSWEFRETNTARVTKANWGGKESYEERELQWPTEQSHLVFRWALIREHLRRSYLKEPPGKEPPARITTNRAVLMQDHLHLLCLWYLCCSSVAKSCLTLCDPMSSSSPGFPVLHYLLEFA